MLGSVLSTWPILTHLTPTSIQRDRYCYYHHTPYKETEVQSSVTCSLRNGSGIWTQTPEFVLSTIILPPASFLFPVFLEFPIPGISFPLTVFYLMWIPQLPIWGSFSACFSFSGLMKNRTSTSHQPLLLSRLLPWGSSPTLKPFLHS